MPDQTNRKPIFDTVRSMLKRGFRQKEVDALDAAILRSGAPNADPIRQPNEIGPRGISLIKRFEGCARLRKDGLIEAYPDPGTGGDPWTIGWGATGHGFEDGSRISAGTVWTQAQCDARLSQDLKRYARDVARAVGDSPTSQNQFDAMVSFHYNTGAIRRATLTKKHIAGDFEGAAAEFRRWNKAGGRVLKGLVRRRSEEERLYRRAKPRQ
ncbi:MAG: lysozyme [Pseudomonadota bacterium]|nr:lysozyme [Pseudomonadota bacterium]